MPQTTHPRLPLLYWQLPLMWPLVLPLLAALTTWFDGPLAMAQSQAQVSPPVGTQVPVLTGHVTNLTQTLSAAQLARIEQALTTFEQRKGSQLAVLLVTTTRTEPMLSLIHISEPTRRS